MTSKAFELSQLDINNLSGGGAGTTGDTMIINGQTYTYFNVIASSIASGRKSIGFAINTSQTA